MTDTICTAKTASGKRCAAKRLTGKKFCFIHDPSQGAKRAAARKRGGEFHRTPHFANAETLPRQVKSVVDVNARLLYVWGETVGMDNSILRNRLLLACCELFYKSIEIGELEARIAALEAMKK